MKIKVREKFFSSGSPADYRIKSEDEYLAELKFTVDRLKSLLDDPQPGLFSWCSMYADAMQKISDMWNKPEDRP